MQREYPPHLLQSLQKMCFNRSRAQARYRKEDWELTFEEYKSVWGDDFWFRGTGIDDYCLKRIDGDGAWDTSNVIVCKRREYLAKGGEYSKR
mgnify:CR=1 FL=1